MYKYLVFFDLDNTLFDENSKVNDEVADALEQIRANGGLPIIATGRNLFEIQDTLKKSKITSAVTANGDYGMLKGKEIFSNTINPGTIDEVYAFTKENGNAMVVMNQEEGGITAYDDLIKKGNALVHAPLPKLITPKFWHEKPVNMLLITNVGLDEAYLEKFGTELTFYRNSPYAIDTVCHDVSKATGVKQLIETAGLTGIPTYAFGDGNNDIPMLDYVDHAVVMGNGRPNVKQHADFITSSNTNHGIVNGLKHYSLI